MSAHAADVLAATVEMPAISTLTPRPAPAPTPAEVGVGSGSGQALTTALSLLERARAELERIRHHTPYLNCTCGRRIFVAALAEQDRLRVREEAASAVDGAWRRVRDNPDDAAAAAQLEHALEEQARTWSS